LDAARSIFISAYLAGAGLPVGTEEAGWSSAELPPSTETVVFGHFLQALVPGIQTGNAPLRLQLTTAAMKDLYEAVKASLEEHQHGC
jgi:hypothetical protein